MRTPVLIAALAGVVVGMPTPASALWAATATGPARLTADTMTNASAFTAACNSNKAKSPVDLVWTISPDTYVSGYRIVRTNTADGTTATLNVTGRTTSSLSDAPPTGKGLAYAYTIRATSTSTTWTTFALAATGVPTYSTNACTTA
jgi:hypothetical protein